MSHAILEIVDGPYAGRKMIVRRGTALTVGRTERSDWVIPHDAEMSSLHFLIEYEGETLVVRDKHSTNGTWRDGERVTESVVKSGTVLRAGKTQFLVTLEQRRTSGSAVRATTASPDMELNLRDTSSMTGPAPLPTRPPTPTPTPMPPVTPVPSVVSPRVAEPTSVSLPVQSGETPQSQSMPTVVSSSAVPAAESSAAPPRMESGVDRAAFLVELRTAPYLGQKIWLSRGQAITIGSSSSADRQFTELPGLAPRHLALDCNDAGLHVVDLNSGEPTFVNGKLVMIEAVDKGDIIKAGSLEMVVTGIGTPIEYHAWQPLASPTSSGTSGDAPPAAQSGGKQKSGASDNRKSSSVAARVVQPVYGAVQTEPDPEVRRMALHAAAWTGQRWLLDLFRQLAAAPDPDWMEHYYVYAIIAPASELPRMMQLGQASPLGGERFRILGAFGHPDVVPLLLQGMESDNPEVAARAGEAYERITGVNVQSDQRATVPPRPEEQPDEFEEEFREEVKLPDPQKATQHWQKFSQQFNKATRICCGMAVDDRWDESAAFGADLRTRWERCLRARYHGQWKGSAARLERLTRPYPHA